MLPVVGLGLAYVAHRRSAGFLLARAASGIPQPTDNKHDERSAPSGMPRALYFQSTPLSTLRGRQQQHQLGAILRTDSENGAPSTGKDQKSPAETAEGSKGDTGVSAKHTPPKKTIMEKIKHEALHYWHGTKLFAKEVKLSSKLVVKVVWGGQLTRREQRQLRRTFTDTVRLVPFLLFVIIPFAELLLPVALKLFPNMLPSTYEDQASAEKKRRKTQDVRNEMARYLKETIAEMNAQRKELGGPDATKGSQTADANVVASTAVTAEPEDSIEDTSEFLNKIRSSGEAVSTADLVRVAHIFEDDLTLDNLSRPQLVSICRFMGVNAFGTDNYLRYQVTNRMRYIRADDKMINTEGIESLSVPELQSACQSRGIRTIGVSPARMREELVQWIELHLDHNIPSTLLILSRIIAAGEPMSQQHEFNADALQATINSLPDNLVNEATLRLAEASGKATSKQKLDVLEEQEELIEDEDEQEKKRKKSEESAETRSKPDAASSEEQPNKDSSSPPKN
ncbi:LETM1 domain-containing protein ylh47 [Coemansia sp. RSA 1646]|nr:LETM1 domain-containing protein ylh47 [Coemansia sp. RSA 1646]KAJ2089122.1 LETM1 domain-containing protein ylh47 [Coemansia sp. RSA 986]